MEKREIGNCTPTEVAKDENAQNYTENWECCRKIMLLVWGWKNEVFTSFTNEWAKREDVSRAEYYEKMEKYCYTS